MSRSVLSGPLAVLTKETDGGLWVPGQDFNFSTGTWTFTRIAIGDYALRKTAAANAPFAVVNLTKLLQKYGSDPLAATGAVPADKPGQSTQRDIRGVQLASFDVVYGIATANLNSHAAVLRRTTYANNVANAVTTPSAVTGTLATATQANPYVSTITVSSPFVIGGNAADVSDWLELQIDAAAGTVYDLYGVYLKFNYNFL